jgi:hypothetical protein
VNTTFVRISEILHTLTLDNAGNGLPDFFLKLYYLNQSIKTWNNVVLLNEFRLDFVRAAGAR